MRSNLQPVTPQEPMPESLVTTLRVRVFVSMALFSLYSLAVYGWITITTHLTGSICGLSAFCISLISLRTHPAWTAFILLTATWCFREFHQTDSSWSQAISLATWGAMLLLARGNYNNVLQTISTQIVRVLESQQDPIARKRIESSMGQRSVEQTASIIAVKGLAEGLLALLMAMGLSTLAAILIGASPLTGRRQMWTKWAIDHNQAIWPNPTLLVLLIGAWIILREWDWRQMDVKQAQIAARSESMRWKLGDLKQILNSRRRLHSKRVSRPRHHQERDE